MDLVPAAFSSAARSTDRVSFCRILPPFFYLCRGGGGGGGLTPRPKNVFLCRTATADNEITGRRVDGDKLLLGFLLPTLGRLRRGRGHFQQARRRVQGPARKVSFSIFAPQGGQKNFAAIKLSVALMKGHADRTRPICLRI